MQSRVNVSHCTHPCIPSAAFRSQMTMRRCGLTRRVKTNSAVLLLEFSLILFFFPQAPMHCVVCNGVWYLSALHNVSFLPASQTYHLSLSHLFTRSCEHFEILQSSEKLLIGLEMSSFKDIHHQRISHMTASKSTTMNDSDEVLPKTVRFLFSSFSFMFRF